MKKKITLDKILGLLALAFAIATLIVPVADAFSFNSLNASSSTRSFYTPFYAFIFGTSCSLFTGSTTITATLYRPATIALTAWVFVVMSLGLFCCSFVFHLVRRDKKIPHAFFFAAALLLLAAGIMFFSSRSSMILATFQNRQDIDPTKVASSLGVKLGFGPVGAGLFSVLSAVCTASATFFKK